MALQSVSSPLCPRRPGIQPGLRKKRARREAGLHGRRTDVPRQSLIASSAAAASTRPCPASKLTPPSISSIGKVIVGRADVNRSEIGRAVYCSVVRICSTVRPEFLSSINAATAATCGAEAEVPKKFGYSSSGLSSPLINVLKGLLSPSPSSSS